MFNLARLQVLSAVARQGTLSAAADELGFTASAVSQQMAALEREAQCQLLERNARGVTLTEAGSVLLRHAELLLAAAEAAMREVGEVRHGDRGTVRLGWFTTSGAALLPQAIARVATDHPAVRLELLEADPDVCVAALRAGSLDMALIYQFALEADPAPDLEQIVLLEDPIGVAMSASHPLAGRKRLSLPDLADESWIQGVGSGSTLAVLPAACLAAGFAPRVVIRTDDHLAVQGLVAAGVGVALLPSIALPTVRPDIVHHRVASPALARQVRLALSPGRDPSPAGERAVRAITATAREMKRR